VVFAPLFDAHLGWGDGFTLVALAVLAWLARSIVVGKGRLKAGPLSLAAGPELSDLEAIIHEYRTDRTDLRERVEQLESKVDLLRARLDEVHLERDQLRRELEAERAARQADTLKIAQLERDLAAANARITELIAELAKAA
jgi:chromosome segregation ATPase